MGPRKPENGHKVNEKRIRRLMRLMGLMPIHQKPNTSRPTKGHKTYPYLARAACVRTGQIRSGVWTSPICRCVAALGMASDRWRLMPRSPWWRSWTGTPAWSWRGGSRTSSHGPPLVRGLARGRRLLRRGAERGHLSVRTAGHHDHGAWSRHGSKRPCDVKGPSSRRLPGQAACDGRASASRWMAKAFASAP